MVDSGIYGPNGEWERLSRNNNQSDSGCGGCLLFVVGLAAVITVLGWIFNLFEWVTGALGRMF
jgi:hypothetical protein